MEYMKEYQHWCERAVADADIVNELNKISSDETKIEDAFYRGLVQRCGINGE